MICLVFFVLFLLAAVGMEAGTGGVAVTDASTETTTDGESGTAPRGATVHHGLRG